MAKKYRVDANFHVDIPANGETLVRRQHYLRGETVAEDKIPEGHTGDGWVAAGLVTGLDPLAE